MANTSDEYMRKARQHASNSRDDVNAAGQHAASAASTVGHDLRAAGQQAADAAKYVGQRYDTSQCGCFACLAKICFRSNVLKEWCC